jgi:hypothetical protein
MFTSNNYTNSNIIYVDDKKVGVSTWADSDFVDARTCYSQPALAANQLAVSVPPDESEIYSFSQPTQVEDLLLSSQFSTSQSVPTTSRVIKKLFIGGNIYLYFLYFVNYYRTQYKN